MYVHIISYIYIYTYTYHNCVYVHCIYKGNVHVSIKHLNMKSIEICSRKNLEKHPLGQYSTTNGTLTQQRATQPVHLPLHPAESHDLGSERITSLQGRENQLLKTYNVGPPLDS